MRTNSKFLISLFTCLLQFSENFVGEKQERCDDERLWHASTSVRRRTTASLPESTGKGGPFQGHLQVLEASFQKEKKKKKNSASLGTFRITPPTPAPNDLRECHEYQYRAWRLLRSSTGPEERRGRRHMGSAAPTDTFSHLQMKCTCHSEGK